MRSIRGGTPNTDAIWWGQFLWFWKQLGDVVNGYRPSCEWVTREELERYRS